MKKVPTFLRALTVVMILLVVACCGFYFYWNEASARSSCESCHEIENSSIMWARSGHRDLPCKECHGTALSSGLHSLKEKGMMFVHHFTGTGPRTITLDERAGSGDDGELQALSRGGICAVAFGRAFGDVCSNISERQAQ
jgi:hypothetical protein